MLGFSIFFSDFRQDLEVKQVKKTVEVTLTNMQIDAYVFFETVETMDGVWSI